MSETFVSAEAPAKAEAVETQKPVPASPTVTSLPFDQIHPSPLNPRTSFDPVALDELASSIESGGLLQNLVVRPHPTKRGHVEIAAGERRWRAVKLLVERGRLPKHEPLPVQIREGMSDVTLVTLALAENIDRRDLDELDEARGYRMLRDAGQSAAEIAQAVGRSKRHVEKRLALLVGLGPEAQAALREGSITLAHAQVMASMAAPERQPGLVERIKDGDYFYKTADDLRRKLQDDTVPVSRAFFPLELYDGAILASAEDPEKPAADDLHEDDWYDEDEDIEPGVDRFADVERFLELQRAAIALRKVELEKTWAWVELLEDEYPGWKPETYNGWRKSKNEKTAGAVIVLHADYSVSVHEGWLKPDQAKAAQGGKKAKETAKQPAQGAKGAAKPWAPVDAMPTKLGLNAAREAKTHALRAALIDKGHEPAMLLVCLALLGAARANVRMRHANYDTAILTVETPAVEQALKQWHKRLKLSRHSYDWNDEKLLEDLLALEPRELHELFTLLVASTLGSYPTNYADPLGDEPFAVRLAGALGADVASGPRFPGGGPHWRLNDEWLATCRKPGLAQIAADIGAIDHEDFGSAFKNGELRQLILDKAAKHSEGTPYLPPALRFGSAEQLLAQVPDPASRQRTRKEPLGQAEPGKPTPLPPALRDQTGDANGVRTAAEEPAKKGPDRGAGKTTDKQKPAAGKSKAASGKAKAGNGKAKPAAVKKRAKPRPQHKRKAAAKKAARTRNRRKASRKAKPLASPARRISWSNGSA